MGKRKVGALEKLEADLPALQNKLRRDPQSYTADFNAQYEQYQNLYRLFLQNPTTEDASIVSLRDYVDFVAHCADCYPRVTAEFADQLIALLTQHHTALETELREKLVTSLVILRNKNLIDSIRLLNALFPILIATHSKSLRVFIFSKILADMKATNAKTTNHKLNRTFQNTLYTLVTADRESSMGLWAIKFTRELWKRQIWTDAKAVDIMKEAALSENPKVIVGGVKFFLGGDKEREEHEEESSDDDAIDMGALRHQLGINKKTKKRAKDLKKAASTVKKKERKKNQTHMLNFSALHLLHDPQGFVERLFSRHLQNTKTKLNLEQKLFVLQLVTRLVGLHQLTLESLYSYFLKYLTPRQPSVTTFLACAAQSSHNLVPPDLLSPIVTKIANEFVSEAAASEVASAGLNGIREICVRQPLAMDDTLLQDLVQYRKSKDKGVTMAAKGLLSLYRNVGAELLNKRDRGKDAALKIRDGNSMTKYGEQKVDEDIQGIELLELYKEEERAKKRLAGELQDESDVEKLLEEEEAEGWKNWDAESNNSDDSGGWIDVASDEEDIVVSDSDDEPAPKKAKLEPEKENMETPHELNLNDHDAPTPASTTLTSMSKKSTLATTRILTPADLAKLKELQAKSSVISTMRNPRGTASTSKSSTHASRHIDDGLTAEQIEGLAHLSHKATREERIAKSKEGKDEKHVSTAALRQQKKQAAGKSSTNREKERQKNLFMTLRKAKSKNKRSLGEVRRVLKGHVDRKKRGGKRGNVGH